jgi:NAD-dependent dihydropyrimidine dehydrogenase PreA subunit
MSSDLNAQGQPYPEQIDAGKCTACGLCFRMCPDGAIEVDAGELSKCQCEQKKD